jgi:hypothetical protein
MIIDLDKVTLEMVRGDTFSLPLELNEGSREYFKRYTLGDDEKLYIGIMKPNQSFENADIRCMLDNTCDKDSAGNVIFKLSPDHTINMNPGKYYFTIKYSNGNDVYTLVDNKLFYITGSIPVIS